MVNRLPKKAIFQEVFADNTEESYAAGISFQYDSLHHVIRCFAEDTSSNNSYRTLAIEYTYNDAGYLVRVDNIEEDGAVTTNIISRQSDNRLKYITNQDQYPGTNDTAYFQYESSNAQTRLNMRRPVRLAQDWEVVDDFSFYYNSDSVLVKTDDNQYGHTTNYTYEGKKLSSMQNNWYDGALSLGYTSGLPERATDSLMRLFLGPDYYLQPVKAFYLFNMVNEDNMVSVSATDPYHPSRLQLSPGLSETPNGIVINVKYSYDGQHRLTKVEMENTGYSTASFRFLY